MENRFNLSVFEYLIPCKESTCLFPYEYCDSSVSWTAAHCAYCAEDYCLSSRIPSQCKFICNAQTILRKVLQQRLKEDLPFMSFGAISMIGAIIILLITVFVLSICLYKTRKNRPRHCNEGINQICCYSEKRKNRDETKYLMEGPVCSSSSTLTSTDSSSVGSQTDDLVQSAASSPVFRCGNKTLINRQSSDTGCTDNLAPISQTTQPFVFSATQTADTGGSSGYTAGVEGQSADTHTFVTHPTEQDGHRDYIGVPPNVSASGGFRSNTCIHRIVTTPACEAEDQTYEVVTTTTRSDTAARNCSNADTIPKAPM